MAKAKIYLYKEGNECASITGGWEYVAFDYEGETLISKKTNYIHHSRTTDSAIRGMLYTKNALNTDNFDKAISEYNIISQTTAGNTNGINFISSRTVGSSGYDYSVDYGTDLGDNITEVAFANNMHICIRQGGNWGTRINANTYNIYLTSKDDLLIINSQDDDIITFSVNNLDFITISKIDVLVNGIVSQTYNGEYSNLSYKVDETLCHVVNNDIEIKVTYSQGDGIVETVSEYLTYTVPKLSTKTPLLDVTKRVVLLTKMKQNEKTVLSNILTSKNIEVTEKDKMLDLINKIQNIKNIDICIDGKLIDFSFELKTLSDEWASISTLPYPFYYGSAILYNNEIHILGGYDNTFKHYKYNGSSWVSVSTLPYNFRNSSVVIYNNEIHILGSDISGEYTKHYKYNGSSWTSVSTLPYNFYCGSAVIYNNEIHILGSNNNGNYTKHYKYNGSSWTSVSTLPYNFRNSSAVIYNNEIHILGGLGYPNNHYKYNGSSWTSVSIIPYNFYQASAVVYNNEIHILGGSASATYTKHYKYDGSSWTEVSTLPYYLYNGCTVVYNDEIHILGSYNNTGYTKHYKYRSVYELIRR